MERFLDVVIWSCITVMWILTLAINDVVLYATSIIVTILMILEHTERGD